MIKNNQNQSKLDRLTGQHTVNILVALLFIVTLVGYIILYCVKDKLPENVTALFSTLLAVLGGFFGGNNFRK